jgi:hypothetical protein
MQTSTGKTGESVYYESSEPGSYGGVRALPRYSGSLVKTVKRWLETQDPYTLHKLAIRKLPRRRTFAKGINQSLFNIQTGWAMAPPPSQPIRPTQSEVAHIVQHIESTPVN